MRNAIARHQDDIKIAGPAAGRADQLIGHLSETTSGRARHKRLYEISRTMLYEGAKPIRIEAA